MTGEGQERQERKIRAVIVLAAGLLIAGGVILGLNWNSWFGASKTAKQPDLDENAVEWEGVQTQEQPMTPDGQPGIALPGYRSIQLRADTLEQYVNLHNPQGNNCYFVMSLVLPDGTQIWKSRMIPPGSGLYQITLDETIPAGTYEDSTLVYECYRQDDELTELNGSEVRLTLEVQ